MATTTAPSTLSPLSFPASTFAKLAPASYLKAHLSPTDRKGNSTRPSGRSPSESRSPSIHIGSLSHSNGSAVVRLGATTVVCGVRAEILRAQDIPHEYRPLSVQPSSEDGDGGSDQSADADEISTLGLLVPNLELSTGCSPTNLPGNPPSTVAQSLTHRLHSLLHSTEILNVADLRITAFEAVDPDADLESGEKREVTKAWWAFYIDTLVISHDGSVFDAAWLAILAALRDTRLPKAEWNADREQVLCDPKMESSKGLHLRSLPLAMTFGVFETGNRIRGIEGQSWMLADLDGFEEEVCRETVTVVVARGEMRRIEKSGGVVLNGNMLRDAASAARVRWNSWSEQLEQSQAG